MGKPINTKYSTLHESACSPASESGHLCIPRKSAYHRILAVSGLFFCLILSISPAAIATDLTVIKTLERLELLEGVTEKEIAAAKDRVSALSYTQKRALRALCLLTNARASELADYFQLLETTNIRFAYIPLLEKYSALADTDVAGFSNLLQSLKSQTFVSNQVVSTLSTLPINNSEELFTLLELAGRLGESGQWAVTRLFAQKDQQIASLTACLYLMRAMSDSQLWAADVLFTSHQLPAAVFYPTLLQLSRLNANDARNLEALFIHPEFEPRQLDSWLMDYFRVPPSGRDAIYATLPAGDKDILLQVFSQARETFIWQINNLHDITDIFGREIGSEKLARFSFQQLRQLFNQLHPAARQRFVRSIEGAVQRLDREAVITALRRATTYSRVQSAKGLSAANLYMLMAHGADLYDSSYREILVPELKQRLEKNHQDHLLEFLLVTDPNAHYVSDFITSLAQKGKLTDFFPKDGSRQKQILELVADSALDSEASLIHFSASFSQLLKTLQPIARSCLLDRLILAATTESTVFSRQVQVIIQYYLNNYPELLSVSDRKRITSLLATRAPIDTSRYTTTPFPPGWKTISSRACLYFTMTMMAAAHTSPLVVSCKDMATDLHFHKTI